VTLVLEIVEKIFVNRVEGEDNDNLKGEMVATRIFQLIQYTFLIYYSWNLFIYFVKKKKQRNDLKRQIAVMLVQRKSTAEAEKIKVPKGFSKSTKFAIGWIFFVLFINTVNLLSYEII
jgi:hypothetical protein